MSVPVYIPQPGARPGINAKLPRPEWWHQEGVVERLQDGAYIGELCLAAAEEMAEAGHKISVTRLRAEVSQWAESASWGERLQSALKIAKNTAKGVIYSKDWYDEFFLAMERLDGVAEKAAQAAGVGYGLVLARLDKRNKAVFDPEFAERFRVAETERLGKLRSLHFIEAEGTGKAAGAIREKILQTHLPALHGPKQEVHVTGGVEVTHGISAELAQAVADASRQRMRVLSGGREKALRSGGTGEVIDITARAERARA